MSEDVDVPILSGWYNRTSWKSFRDVCTNPYVHESEKDGLHRALISLAVAVEGR
jgi:hypothetical protein